MSIMYVVCTKTMMEPNFCTLANAITKSVQTQYKYKIIININSYIYCVKFIQKHQL